MNWLTKLKDIELEITTGDGKKYKPLWKDAEKEKNYNSEGFDFIGLQGTYVARGESSSNQYPIYFVFQGDDHLEVSRAFEISSENKNPWTIKHPYYDDLTVQPLALKFDNKGHNVTQITGVVWETINLAAPSSETSAPKIIENLKAETDLIIENNYNNLFDPDTNDIQPANLSALKISSNYKVLGEDLEDLQNFTREATAAALNILSAPDAYITAIQNLINFPFQIEQKIEFKLQQLYNNIVDVFEIVENILYDSQGSTIVSESCVNAITADYENVSEVLNSIDLISDTYNFLIAKFDETGYIQTADQAIKLDLIVNATKSELFKIAFDAKQERIKVLEKDSNIIVVANELIGSGDDNLQQLLNWNNFSLDRYLVLKKGDSVRYYV